MDYEIAVSDDRTYIYICPRKNIVSIHLPERFSRHAHEMGSRLGIKKIFADCRKIISRSDAIDKYIFAYEKMAELGFTRDWRVALLRRPENADLEFLETVMRNVGFDFRIFTDEELALDWLKS